MKFKLFYFIPFLFSMLIISLPVVADNEATVVVEHWPPWEIADDENHEKITGGIAVELLTELFSRIDVKMTLKNVPWKRALVEIEKGNADLVPMVARNDDRSKYMLFTVPIYKDPILLVYSTKKFENFKWENWEDLKSYSFGTVRGYIYGEDWNRASSELSLKIEIVKDDATNIRKLIGGRIDLTPHFYSVFKHSHGEYQNNELLRLAKKPIHKNILYFGISKKSFLADRLSEINSEIIKMKEDGTFKKILKEFYVEK